MHKQFLITASFLGALSVLLGAFAAHKLKDILEAQMLQTFETAVKYQMYHALAMLGLFLFSKQNPHKYINWAFNSFLIGIVMFSGSLYFLCTRNLLGIEGLKVLGPITPIGGLFFIAGWIFIALIGLKKKSN